MSLDYTLDENGQLTFHLQEDASGHLKATLSSEYDRQDSPLVKNLLPMMRLNGVAASKENQFELPLPAAGEPITLTIGDQVFGRFEMTPAGIKVKEQKSEDAPRKLCVFETRIIGRSAKSASPYHLQDEAHKKDYDAMLANLPVTDLHTHVSAQVKAEDLLEIGKNHHVLYPITALHMLGIKGYDKHPEVKQVAKRVFLPLAHLQNNGSELEDVIPLSVLAQDKNALRKIGNAMSLSPEGQNTYEDMEICYYLREPFTKDLSLLPDMLRAIARRYHDEGVQYAEMTSNAVLDPATRRKDGSIQPSCLEIIHNVLPAIEKEFDVKLRFRAGLPRNLSQEALAGRIERYKQVAKSPYLVGTDILGYEINKTSGMKQKLEELATWMTANVPGDSMQIHAGENSKNLDNVREALEIGQRHNIRVHIGHALYGSEGAAAGIAKQLARDNLVLSQFNIDSNLALNNIDFPEHVPITRLIKAQIKDGSEPSNVISSDGADIYRTDRKQTAMAALICGVDAEGFKAIRSAEANHIARQEVIFDAKMQEYKKTKGSFFDGFVADEKPAVAPRREEPVQLPWALKKLIDTTSGLPRKRPIFFAGAGGSSWDHIPPEEVADFRRGLDELLERIDPARFYFAKGRTKDAEGVNSLLADAITRYNASHTQPFECVTVLAKSEKKTNANDASQKKENDSSAHFHTLELSQALVNLPSGVMKFLSERNGVAFFAGGKSFTRDFIIKAKSRDYKIPFGLMENISGASREKALVYPDHAFSGSQGLLEYADKMKLTGAPERLSPSNTRHP